MPELQQSGIFRGRISSYGLNKANSGAMSVAIRLAVDDVYSDGEWFDWSEHRFEAEGNIWLVKKDGTLNETQVRALVDHASWDGNLTSIVAGDWRPIPVQAVVDEDEYNGQVRYRINWINGYDSVPGGGNVSAEEAKTLQNQYGPQLRALAGNSQRNASVPGGKPAKPAAGQKKTSKTPAPAAEPKPEECEGTDIPF